MGTILHVVAERGNTIRVRPWGTKALDTPLYGPNATLSANNSIQNERPGILTGKTWSKESEFSDRQKIIK